MVQCKLNRERCLTKNLNWILSQFQSSQSSCQCQRAWAWATARHSGSVRQRHFFPPHGREGAVELIMDGRIACICHGGYLHSYQGQTSEGGHSSLPAFHSAPWRRMIAKPGRMGVFTRIIMIIINSLLRRHELLRISIYLSIYLPHPTGTERRSPPTESGEIY